MYTPLTRGDEGRKEAALELALKDKLDLGNGWMYSQKGKQQEQTG